MKLYSREWFEKYKDIFAEMYFKNSLSIKGIRIPMNNRTSEQVREMEDNFYKDDGKVDIVKVAWKLGRLDDEGDIIYDDGNKTISDSYGNKISKKELKKYLEEINIDEVKQSIEENCFEKAFKTLESSSPPKFGTVYIITLMHFISNGKVPIYDRFTHKAVKAIYAMTLPSKIYVGAPPGKKSAKEAINMLSEYMWLLEKEFGKSDIDRLLDRALWVYGHEAGIVNGKIEVERYKTMRKR